MMELKDSENNNEESVPYGSDIPKDENEEYGLPEVQYEPINHNQPEPIAPAFTQSDSSHKKVVEKEKNYTPAIVLFIVLLVAVGAGSYFLFFHEAEEPVTAEYVPYEEPVVVEEPIVEYSEEPVVEYTDPTPVVGTYENISQRTGRSYIVIGSFIDEDLALDEAKALANKGISSKLIRPYNKVRYYRLAVEDHGSFSEAANNLENLKSTYGENIWVLKY